MEWMVKMEEVFRVLVVRKHMVAVPKTNKFKTIMIQMLIKISANNQQEQLMMVV